MYVYYHLVLILSLEASTFKILLLIAYVQYVQSQALNSQTNKMVKHTQTIHRILLTNCLSVFDHFLRMALKKLSKTFYT